MPLVPTLIVPFYYVSIIQHFVDMQISLSVVSPKTQKNELYLQIHNSREL